MNSDVPVLESSKANEGAEALLCSPINEAEFISVILVIFTIIGIAGEFIVGYPKFIHFGLDTFIAYGNVGLVAFYVLLSCSFCQKDAQFIQIGLIMQTILMVLLCIAQGHVTDRFVRLIVLESEKESLRFYVSKRLMDKWIPVPYGTKAWENEYKEAVNIEMSFISEMMWFSEFYGLALIAVNFYLLYTLCKACRMLVESQPSV